MILLFRQLINNRNIICFKSKSIHLSAIKLITKKELKMKQMKREETLTAVRNLVFNNDNTNDNHNSVQSNVNTVNWHQITVQLIEQKVLYPANFELSLMSAFQCNYETHLNMSFDETYRLNRELFLSLNKYLKEKANLRKNTTALSRYCLFISDYGPYLDQQMLTEIREVSDYIIERYLQKKEIIATVQDCLIALSKSSRDNCNYAMNLLTKCEHIIDNNICANAMITAAFKHQLYGHGFHLLKLASNYLRIALNNDTIKHALDAIIEFQLSDTEFLEVLTYFSKKFVIFNEQFKPLIEKIMSRYGYGVSALYIGHTGLCSNCNESLKQLNDNEFKVLSQNMQSIVFNKEDNPLLTAFYRYEQELNVFNDFLKTRQKPFDLVIDGLNISYGTAAKYVPDSKNLRALVLAYPVGVLDQRIVDFFKHNHILEQFSNILLIGRSHMNNWKKLGALLSNNKDRLTYFYVLDKANDDSYVLLAAAHNINTKIVSNDFFSDFRDKMVMKNLGHLFYRWLQTRQVFLGEFKYILLPHAYDYTINLSQNTIHIPLIKDTNGICDIMAINNRDLITNCRTNAITWLCCRKTLFN